MFLVYHSAVLVMVRAKININTCENLIAEDHSSTISKYAAIIFSIPGAMKSCGYSAPLGVSASFHNVGVVEDRAVVEWRL